MGLHKPFDRDFFVLGGSVMTDGISTNLAKGQFGIFDVETGAAPKAVTSFKGQPKNKKYELRLGKADVPVTRSQNNFSYSSFPFSLKDVMNLKVSSPETTEQKVDEVIVGYNGISDDTAIQFKAGDRKKLVVRLEGEPIGLLGYTYNFVDVPIYMEADRCIHDNGCSDCEDPCSKVECLPIILDAIEQLKNHQLRGGTKVSDYIDVTPIHKCNQLPTVEETPYNFYCLDVCDTGDESALSLIQSQYPKYKVERTGRNGAISSYQLLAPASAGTPTTYKQTLPSLIKGCQVCPVGYTEVEGGFIYAVTLEDDGIDRSSIVETLTNAVAGTAIKADAQNDGVGYYTVVLTQKLSDANFRTFVDTNDTATITFVGETKSICTNDTVTSIAWTQCGTCNVTRQTYVLDLPDNECGENRLAELQLHYPSLTIELEGTTGGCQTRYQTTVESNLVCEECDPIFKDYYKTEAPANYDGRKWVLSGATTVGSDCMCGISLKGKILEVHPDECLRFELGFVDSSVLIRASGGFITEVREGIGEIVDNPFAVEYKSRWQRRTHLGGNLWDFEERSRVFFTGESNHPDSLVARMFKGEETVVTADKQYVDYALTLNRHDFSQSFSGREDTTITYHVMVEVGRHQAVEDVLNSLAASAGINPVKAFGS